jgi:hypothetical protein
MEETQSQSYFVRVNVAYPKNVIETFSAQAEKRHAKGEHAFFSGVDDVFN